MAQPKRNVSRYRLSVPEADAAVNAWIEKQDNLSVSLRYVIKEAIRNHGMTDVMCMDLPSDTGMIMQYEPVAAEASAPVQEAPVQVQPQVQAPVEAPKPEPQPMQQTAPQINTSGMSQAAGDALASMLG